MVHGFRRYLIQSIGAGGIQKKSLAIHRGFDGRHFFHGVQTALTDFKRGTYQKKHYFFQFGLYHRVCNLLHCDRQLRIFALYRGAAGLVYFGMENVS